MLVICNGAFKSGSTWMHALVSSIMQIRAISLTPVPQAYSSGNSKVSLIAESQLERFVQTEDIAHNNYLTKAHFFKETTLERSYPKEVVFIFIERDIRDAIVSHYYHFMANNNLNISFRLYYWLIGRYKAYEISLFNHRCRLYFGDSNFFCYEEMKADVAVAIQRLCNILGVAQLTEAETQAVIAETSLDAMREKAKAGKIIYYHSAGGRHSEMFRKGAIGEYKDHFDASMLRDIAVAAELRFSAINKYIYQILFTYRRALR
jgi:Sulfotransferase domain